MTATAQRPTGTPVVGQGIPARAPLPADEEFEARRGEVHPAAADLADEGRAEARAVGAQMRCIHWLWLAAQADRTVARYEAMTQAEADYTARGWVRPDPLGSPAQPEHELVTDVAAEVGPALHLPAGTARRRVEDSVDLAEDLPQVLAALEAGDIGPAQTAVMVEQWRELVVEAPTWTSLQRTAPPVEAVSRLVGELLEAAPHSTAAQLRATVRARRAVLVADAAERARRAARKHRAVWVEPAGDGTACLHALLDAHVAVAAHARLEELVARLGEEVPAPCRAGLAVAAQPERPEETEPRSTGELRADVLADLLLDGVLPQEPGFPHRLRRTGRPAPPDRAARQHLPVPRLPPPRRELRPRPHPGLGRRRTHSRAQPRRPVPDPPPDQAPRRDPGPLDRATTTNCHPIRTTTPAVLTPPCPGALAPADDPRPF